MENTPGPTPGVTLMGESVPSDSTPKTSILLVCFSVTAKNWPSGLKLIEAPPGSLLVRKRVEFSMCDSRPRFMLKPVTLLPPAALRA